MKKFNYLILVVLTMIFLFSCAKNPIQKGDEALQKGQYAEALKAYTEALKAQPDNQALKEKMAIAYLKQGESIYRRMHVISAFEARVTTALKYIPEQPSTELQNTLSQIYYELALAYKDAQPENPYQKLKYFKKTMDYLEKSLNYNPENQQAQTALENFKKAHFQEMFDKGKDYLKKAKRDPVHYIAAEYYLSNAYKLDPQNKQVQKYLTLVRKKYLNILDPGQDVPIAITDQLKKKGFLAFLVVVKNQTEADLPISAKNFYLISATGEAIPGSASDQFANPLANKTLSDYEEAEGVVAFPVKPGQKYVRLEFRKDNQVLGYKNLP